MGITTLSATARAGLWMSGAIASFCVMAISGRELGADYDTFEIMFYRSAVGLVLVCAGLSVLGAWPRVSLRRPGIHLLRNAFHFTGQNLWFFALATIPLAQVFALEFTSPIWVVLLSPLILGETMTRTRLTAVLTGFGGALLIIWSGYDPRAGGTELWGLIAAATAAIFFALTNIMTKRMTRDISIASILLYLTMIQLALGLICAGWDGTIAPPSAQALPLLLLVGLGGISAHLCITNALAIAPAMVVMPFDFARLPVITVIGALIYGEAVGILLIIGAAIVIGANVLNLRAERVRGATVTQR